jgi:hypothetical protein
MARSRNIKPGFFKNEVLASLPAFTRLLFAGIWTLADREGRLEDRPMRMKMELFPCDNVNVEEMLQQLEGGGFIKRYEVNGEKLVQVLAWSKHQNPHHTEKASTYPDIHGGLTVKEPSKPSEPRKQDGGNLADSLLLIPDSLIPDSLGSVPIGTGADAPNDRDFIFANGVALLTVAGVADKNARSMLAMLSKRHGEPSVAAAIQQAAIDRPIEPVSWLQAVLAGRPSLGIPNRQETLEARNKAVAAAWLAEDGVVQ